MGETLAAATDLVANAGRTDTDAGRGHAMGESIGHEASNRQTKDGSHAGMAFA
jgi:hypothetical protein